MRRTLAILAIFAASAPMVHAAQRTATFQVGMTILPHPTTASRPAISRRAVVSRRARPSAAVSPSQLK
jgi:hypothetical protein